MGSEGKRGGEGRGWESERKSRGEYRGMTMGLEGGRERERGGGEREGERCRMNR